MTNLGTSRGRYTTDIYRSDGVIWIWIPNPARWFYSSSVVNEVETTVPCWADRQTVRQNKSVMRRMRDHPPSSR